MCIRDRFLYKQTKSITFDEFKVGINYTDTDARFEHNLDSGRGKKCGRGKLWSYANNSITLNARIRKFLRK